MLLMREYRKRARLSQADVAKIMNVDQSAVSLWENGVNRPCRKYWAKLAKVYGVPENELFKESEENADAERYQSNED